MGIPSGLEAVTELLEQLARTPGPSLGEGPRRQVLEDYFLKQQVPCQKDGAGNLWVSHGQGAWEDTVVYDAHLDVVQDGFSRVVDTRDGLMYGMGVADNLSAVTLLAFFAVYLNRENLHFKRPLAFLFSVGEEGDGNLAGIRQAVADHPEPPHAFVSFDLSFDEYSLSGLGSMRYTVHTTCPGGHSWGEYGMPSAIDRMIGFLYELKEHVMGLDAHRDGFVSFNIGTVSGGEGINSIARKALATFEFRSPDPALLEHMNRVVDKAVSGLNNLSHTQAECSLTGHRPAARPVFPERMEPHVVRILRELGENPKPVVRSTNINASLEAGWPSICLGLCRGSRFHSPDEYVEIDSLHMGWDVLCRLSEALLGWLH